MSSYFLEPPRSDELFHYGVLGMKWGEHRAAKAGKTYTYKSWGTKHNEKKAANALRKEVHLKNKSAMALASGNTNKAAKLSAAANKQKIQKYKFDRRADRSREMDRFEQNRAKGMDTASVIGGRAASLLITGNPTGMIDKAYSQYQAISAARGKNPAALETKGKSIAMALVAGRAGSAAAKAVHIRQGEKEYVDRLAKTVSDNKRQKSNNATHTSGHSRHMHVQRQMTANRSASLGLTGGTHPHMFG